MVDLEVEMPIWSSVTSASLPLKSLSEKSMMTIWLSVHPVTNL